MKYKGYTGVAEFDEDSGVIFGRVIGLRDVITFQGESVSELTQAFHDSVDDYLEFCASREESPEKPFSGQFVVRIDPALHRALSVAAEMEGASLNSVVETMLRSSIAGRSGQPRRVAASGGSTEIMRDEEVLGKRRDPRKSAKGAIATKPEGQERAKTRKKTHE